MKRLNDHLLECFIPTFFGYGSFAADYWFIGMEEGLGEEINEVYKRLDIWDELGKPELTDMADFYKRLGKGEFFNHPVKVQKTWSRLSRLALAFRGKDVNENSVKNHQGFQLGRKGKDTCLLELMPLPSPNTAEWHYNMWSDIPYLKNRESYDEACLPFRTANLHRLINEHHPKVVIFYGKTRVKEWRHVAGSDIGFKQQDEFEVSISNTTLFLIIQHPAWGVSNMYLDTIGRFVFSYLAGIK